MDSCRATKCSAEPTIDQQKVAKSAAADRNNSISSASVSQVSTIDYDRIMNYCSLAKYSAQVVDAAINQQKATDNSRSVTNVVRKDSNELAGGKPMSESLSYNLLVTMKRMYDDKESILVSSQKTAELLARTASIARDIENRSHERRLRYEQLASSDIPNSQDVSYDNFVVDWEGTVDQCESIADRCQEIAELAAKDVAGIKAAIDETQNSFDNSKMVLQKLGNILGIDIL